MQKSNTPPDPVLHPHPRPYFPWVIWGLCIIFHFYRYFLNVVLYILESPIGGSLIEIGGVGTFVDYYSYAVILCQLPVAFLLDRYGPRKISSLGLLLSSLGAMIVGFSHDNVGRIIALIMMGAGGTVSMAMVLKLVSNWFPPRYFSIMAGITTLVGIIGAAVGFPLTLYFSDLLGWRQSIVDFGITGILYALLFFLVVRDNEPGARYNINPPPKQIDLFGSIKRALKKKENWFIALYFSLLVSPWTTFIGAWQIPFLESVHHIERQSCVLINIFDILGFAIGPVFFAWFSNRLNKRLPLMYLGPVVAALLVAIKIYVPDLPAPLLMITSFLEGFFGGSYILGFPLIHEKNIPLITATVVSLPLLLTAIFRPIEDHIISFTLSIFAKDPSAMKTLIFAPEAYRAALAVVPISTIISLIWVFFIKDSNCKQVFEEN